MGKMRRALWLSLTLLLLAAGALAGEAPKDLSVYLPASREVGGWARSEEPQVYRGEDLYMMINGGAGIYHEYGFKQVLGVEYVDEGERPVRVEIYEMNDPAAAYGIYTFKVAYDGKPMPFGQEALLEGNYLNFWEGNIQVTVGGWRTDEETVKGVIALAKAIDRRIELTGERPELVDRFLNEPLPFINPRYVRGPLGVMNNSIFGPDDIFQVREGLIGTVDHGKALVFSYESEARSFEAFNDATDRILENARFRDGVKHDTWFSVVGPKRESMTINHAGSYILAVIGENSDEAVKVSRQLADKLK